MDNATWTSIESTFAPIRGVDLSTMRHPVLSLVREAKLERFFGKVFALLVSEFRHVLMVDADSMPVQHPLNFFQHPLYQASGNLMWPDAWQGKVQGRAYETFGLKPGVVQDVVPQDVLHRVNGSGPFDAESGQLLIDRAQHLDVLEYLVWINSRLQAHADTLSSTSASSPLLERGFFTFEKDMLLVKDTKAKEWGWRLMASSNTTHGAGPASSTGTMTRQLS
eukprot:gene30959-12134_t